MLQTSNMAVLLIFSCSLHLACEQVLQRAVKMEWANVNSNCPLHWLSHQVIVLILPFLFFFFFFFPFFLFFFFFSFFSFLSFFSFFLGGWGRWGSCWSFLYCTCFTNAGITYFSSVEDWINSFTGMFLCCKKKLFSKNASSTVTMCLSRAFVWVIALWVFVWQSFILLVKFASEIKTETFHPKHEPSRHSKLWKILYLQLLRFHVHLWYLKFI